MPVVNRPLMEACQESAKKKAMHIVKSQLEKYSLSSVSIYCDTTEDVPACQQSNN